MDAAGFNGLYNAISVQGRVVGKQDQQLVARHATLDKLSNHLHQLAPCSASACPLSQFHITHPEEYDGDINKCQGFLL